MGTFNVCRNSTRLHTLGKKNLQTTTKPTFTRQSEMDILRKKLEILKSKQKPGQTLADIFQSKLDKDILPPSPTPNTKSHDVAYMIINKDELCTAYTDLTGQIPFKSSRCNQYVMVEYHNQPK